ncbi:MAG: DUF2911 domain-containing protein [Winogradskyella sp.]|uniref:DUF2911 domain-containing protein n=1 Tax=Winogradskyella sp. TaxID=1883156 RepID=UPI000F3ADDBC|nr:DUF2911 domain-containing protein [Winogradskyella sp.]RNC86414.1 MAG: DUF2911 domain-containing protein [Winogradskyella sp.]
MKNRLTFLFAFLLLATITVNAQLNTPRGSQMASVMQRVGTTDITITYSRPSVNDREIWGKLVPYGLTNLGFGTSKAAPWRAGANENTTISFTHDVKIQGKAVAAGTYGLHLNVKDANNATLILSTDKDAWGSYFYEPKNDVLTADIVIADNAFTELLTFSFDAVDKNSTTAALKWEKKAFPFKIEVDVTDIVLSDIRSQFKGQKGFSRQNWEQAANFALNNDGDLDEALQWVNAALDGQFFSQKTFNGLAIKAQILQKKGDAEGFGTTMDEALGLANPGQINRMGYAMIRAEDYDRAIKYFKTNVESDSKNANWHSSLADGYKAKGDVKSAKKHYTKALSLNPNDRVKASIEKGLKELNSK